MRLHVLGVEDPPHLPQPDERRRGRCRRGSTNPSPSTTSFDRTKKLAIYAREGVPWAWLIDPLARTLEVLKLENGHWTILATHAGNEVARAEPFEAIELELAALWGDVGSGPPSAD